MTWGTETWENNMGKSTVVFNHTLTTLENALLPSGEKIMWSNFLNEFEFMCIVDMLL